MLMGNLTEKEILKYRQIFTETDGDMSAMFKVLSEINRYRIFLLLLEPERISIGNIAKILSISIPLTSQHVSTLVNAGLLKKQRNGKRIYPKIEHLDPLVKKIILTLKKIT